ncbi:putative chitinase domain-containing protein 1 [Sesbania bispinosa]|nr:putative chitinase domain-containing protein 1 [Sesbania bispinosa]
MVFIFDKKAVDAPLSESVKNHDPKQCSPKCNERKSFHPDSNTQVCRRVTSDPNSSDLVFLTSICVKMLTIIDFGN